LVGGVLVGSIALAAVLAPWLAPYDPSAQAIVRRLRPPIWAAGTLEHVLGTDSLGRDVLSRLLFGARVSLLVGLSAVAVQGAVGTVLGLTAGYFKGRVDLLIMRLADLQLSIPPLVLAIGVIAVLGSSLTNIILILGLTGWPYYGRLVRSEVLSIRERDFVLAARAVGASDSTILWRHVFPNVTTSLTVAATFAVPLMIIAEASLSFLGLGVPPSVPTWGSMVADGRDFLGTAWWIATLPGIAILLTVLGINLFGDGLRDALDPRTRRAGLSLSTQGGSRER
jgi:peptide/nickel transport system permease protein